MKLAGSGGRSETKSYQHRPQHRASVRLAMSQRNLTLPAAENETQFGIVWYGMAWHDMTWKFRILTNDEKWDGSQLCRYLCRHCSCCTRPVPRHPSYSTSVCERATGEVEAQSMGCRGLIRALAERCPG